jgi:pilus assembly protein FimV
MKKRTSLNEGHIRRFMALAGTGALSENFVDLMTEEEPEEEELDMDAELAPPVEMPAEEPALDMEDEEPTPDEAPAAGGVDVVSLVDAIANAIEQETGVSISTEESAEEAPMDDMAAEEPALDMPAEEPALDLGTDEEAPMEDEDLLEVDLVEDDELVNEVLRRVARRLTSK